MEKSEGLSSSGCGRPARLAAAPNWNPKTIAVTIRNPVYKGEFVAHRYQETKVIAANQRPGQPTRFAVKKVERPSSEWITISVPPIVSPELCSC